MMNAEEKKKAEQAHSTLKSFTDQFGENDLCKLALIDVILEAIYGETTDDLDIPGATGQETSEDFELGRPGDMPTYEIT